MLFNSYQFIFGFLPAVCVSYFVVARFWGRRAGMGVLVAASLFFYGWWNDRYLWILLLSIGGREKSTFLDSSCWIGIQSAPPRVFQICELLRSEPQHSVRPRLAS